MEQVFHTKLGDSRRLAIPAELCRILGLNPGDDLVLTPKDDGLSVTTLRGQAERMRQELRQLLGDTGPLTEDLRHLRQAEAVREADRR